MKVIIAGSRDITDYNKLLEAIKLALNEGIYITEVVSGMANGVDKLGIKYAANNNLIVKEFPAQWQCDGRYNPQAGLQRNFEMAKYSDAAVILWNETSHGTWNMICHMKGLGKPYFLMRIPK